jgi:hypothetical protein
MRSLSLRLFGPERHRRHLPGMEEEAQPACHSVQTADFPSGGYDLPGEAVFTNCLERFHNVIVGNVAALAGTQGDLVETENSTQLPATNYRQATHSLRPHRLKGYMDIIFWRAGKQVLRVWFHLEHRYIRRSPISGPNSHSNIAIRDHPHHFTAISDHGERSTVGRPHDLRGLRQVGVWMTRFHLFDHDLLNFHL